MKAAVLSVSRVRLGFSVKSQLHCFAFSRGPASSSGRVNETLRWGKEKRCVCEGVSV